MNYTPLTDALGYVFTREALLRRALTHPSFGAEDNQRLEFLGDAVLELCVSESLYRAHPGMQEGGLTRLRAGLVRMESLAQAAESVALSEYLLMDKSCEMAGGRQNPSVLCDAMEAVIAAVYLDGGLQAAQGVVARLLSHIAGETELDAKSELQMRRQARELSAPEYAVVEESGLAHQRVFTVAVLLDGREVARGTGATKKKAEQEAARRALALPCA